MRKLVLAVCFLASSAFADGVIDASPRVPLVLPTDKGECLEADPTMCVDRRFFTPYQQKIEDAETTLRRIRTLPLAVTSADSWLSNEKVIQVSGAIGCLQWTGTAFTNLAVATDARVTALEAAVAALQGGQYPAQTPTCSSLTPSSGAAGTQVSIAGGNLNTASSVKFNGTSATFSIVSAGQVSTVVPVGANTGAVTIVTAGGTATCPTFTIAAAADPTLADYYVSAPTNTPAGSDSNPGTISQPFATLTQANTVVTAGKKVLVRGGTYAPPSGGFVLSASGSSGSPITYEAYPGETPVLDGTGVSLTDGQVRITGDWIVFRGFEVTNSGIPTSARRSDIYITGTDVTVDRNVLHHSSYVGVTIAAAYGHKGKRATVTNNHVYDHDDDSIGGADGIACVGPDPAIPTGSAYYYGHASAQNAVIRGNYVHDNTDDGIDVAYCPGNLIEGNVSYHNGFAGWATGQHHDGNGIKVGIDTGDGGYNVVRYNLVTGNAVRGIVTNGSNGNVIYSNTVYATGSGIQVDTLLDVAKTGTTYIYNNISQGNSGTGYLLATGNGSTSFTATVTRANNNFDLSISNCSLTNTAAPAGATSVADWTGFRLGTGSTCVDKGSASFTAYGQTFTPTKLGVAPDLGAYEAR